MEASGTTRRSKSQIRTYTIASCENVTSAASGVTKKLWRKGFIECPKVCSADTPAINCTCELAQRVHLKYPNYTAYEILNITGALQLYEAVGAVFPAHDKSLRWDVVLAQVANGGHSGNIMTDSSPIDPTFWILHGMSERYLQMVRFLNDTGNYNFEQAWSTYAAPGYRTHCDWQNVTDVDQFPVDNTSIVCEGHKAHDMLIYPNLLYDQGTEFLSNAEYFNMTAAFSPHLPHVYDQLLNWTECGWLFGATNQSSV